MSNQLKEFREQCLKAHNEYRAKHHVSPLKLDSALNQLSQEWAENLAAKSVMQHRPNCDKGENVYYSYSSDPNHKVEGKAAVDSWYDEIKLYTFGVEPKKSGTGHFTQVIWKNSKLLGVGVSRNNKNQTFVVCNYDPAGNYIGQHAENVLKN